MGIGHEPVLVFKPHFLGNRVAEVHLGIKLEVNCNLFEAAFPNFFIVPQVVGIPSFLLCIDELFTYLIRIENNNMYEF